MSMGYYKRHLVVFEHHNNRSGRHVNVAFEPDQLVDGKALLVRLSDENDLYFLFHNRISSDDFASLKTQQGLLVDFTAFGQKVIDLLDLCLREESSSNPRYTLRFSTSNNESEGVLQIVEATNFKYLIHLSLTLRAGDDDALKSYLVTQLKALKAESQSKINNLTSTLADVSARLSECEQASASSSCEFLEYKASSKLREDNMVRTYEDRIRMLEEKMCQAEATHKNAIENEQRLSEKACENVRQELSSKADRLMQENQELKVEQEQLHAKVKRFSNQITVLEDQLALQNSEITSLRSKLSSAEQTTQSKASDISRLENRLSVLEQEVTAKDQLLSKTQALLNSEQEHKSRLQDELQQNCRQVEKLQASLNKETDEVSKANEIIKRLQAEVKSQHTKAKLRGQVAAEQERLLSAKDTEMQELHNEVERLKRELKESKDSVSQLTEQVRSTSAELVDAQQTIKTNENIIGWLNRQISENQIGNVQHRLRSVGFPTPLNAVGTARLLSPPKDLNSNATNLQIAPPWYPSGSSVVPCNTIIARSTPPSTTLQNIFPGSNHSSAAATSTGTDGATNCASKPNTNPTYSLRTVNGTGTYSLNPPADSEPNILARKSGTQQMLLPAPITKSTPLHMDYIPHSVGPTDPTASVRSGPVTSSSLVPVTLSQHKIPLPVYVPSTLLTRTRQPCMDAAITGMSSKFYQTARQGSAVTSGQDDTIHQQSLTSAYFPKPVGASVQR
ncbi:hypothetical protein CRM22_003590 [Opisthorchis felineus]|uniref:Spindle assembly abnormal protein 6 N-terminal domain-containing protein n=1 Tax=Opisthorchis felineus TaxID=147828 RepID=A0A4S2M0H3_OPIFE|nr:hypothetical protein CRM22_003590 [Opisthorchis felineus]TGZ69683.1 hypothetical protein CRM22_003590 [Opisthorchis felineus]